MAYATIEDLESRWRILSEGESAKATVMLEDAAVEIDMLGFAEVDPRLLTIVSCNAVRAAFPPDGQSLDDWQVDSNAGRVFISRADIQLLRGGKQPTGELHL